MIDPNDLPAPSTQNKVPKLHLDSPLTDKDDKVRWFLARATVILMPLPFVVYLITRDIAIVATSTIIGVAVTSVYSYYFWRKKT